MGSAFANIVKDYDNESENLDLSGAWKPDKGTYNVSLSDVTSGVSDKGNAWVRATLGILDGDLKDRTFADLFVFKPGQAAEKSSFPSLRNLALLATTVAGREIKQPSAAVGALEQAIGACLVVEIGSRVAKNGNTYTTIDYKGRIDG